MNIILFLILMFILVIYIIKSHIEKRTSWFTREFSFQLKNYFSVITYESFVEYISKQFLLPKFIISIVLKIPPNSIHSKVHTKYISEHKRMIDDLERFIYQVENNLIYRENIEEFWSKLIKTISSFSHLPHFNREFFLYYFVVDYAHSNNLCLSKEGFLKKIKKLEYLKDSVLKEKRNNARLIDQATLSAWASKTGIQHNELAEMFFGFSIVNKNLLNKRALFSEDQIKVLSLAMQEDSYNSPIVFYLFDKLLFKNGKLDKNIIKLQYKWLAQKIHPDSGGSLDKMQNLNNVMEKIRLKYF